MSEQFSAHATCPLILYPYKGLPILLVIIPETALGIRTLPNFNFSPMFLNKQGKIACNPLLGTKVAQIPVGGIQKRMFPHSCTIVRLF